MAKGTTKSQGQKHELDKFYTKPSIALQCIKTVDLSTFALIVEPSAGSGSFSSQLPQGSIALDLHPEAPGIVEQDFMLYEPPLTEGKILVIGNPPFGQQNSLAIRFINHAATFADTVAFIVPRSFDKESVQRRIDRRLHLKSSMTLPNASFTLEGADYGVPCIFQTWTKGDEPRNHVALTKTTTHLDFVKKQAQPDFTIRRVGGNAGKASLITDVSEQTNYFVRNKTHMENETLVDHINSLSFPKRDLGVGPRSISKGELIEVLEESLKPQPSVN